MRQDTLKSAVPDGKDPVEDVLLKIREGLADSLSRLAPEQHEAFLHQFVAEAENIRGQVESHFVPIWEVHKAITTFGEGIWQNDLRDILFFIYKRGDIKGELTPKDVIRLIDSIGPEEIVRSLKGNSPKGIRISQITKIRRTSEFIIRQRSEFRRR